MQDINRTRYKYRKDIEKYALDMGWLKLQLSPYISVKDDVNRTISPELYQLEQLNLGISYESDDSYIKHWEISDLVNKSSGGRLEFNKEKIELCTESFILPLTKKFIAIINVIDKFYMCEDDEDDDDYIEELMSNLSNLSEFYDNPNLYVHKWGRLEDFINDPDNLYDILDMVHDNILIAIANHVFNIYDYDEIARIYNDPPLLFKLIIEKYRDQIYIENTSMNFIININQKMVV